MGFQQDTQIWWRGIFIAYLLLAACGVDNSQAVQTISTCISPNSLANPYRAAENTLPDIIYDPYKLGTRLLKDAQHQAFIGLEKYTQHWSTYTDIFIKNGIGARITVTYIHPELVHFIVLNHELKENHSFVADFRRDLNDKLEKLAKREEMLFMITITAPSYNDQFDASQQLVLDMPMDQMRLTNAANVTVFTTHDDHVLDELIPFTRRPVAGVVGFPLAIMQNDQCNWVMDPTYNTTITIGIPSVSVNGQPYRSQSWSIPYATLVDHGVDINLTTIFPDPNFNYSRVSPLETPPSPVWDISVIGPSDYWNTYWQDVGRYLWHHIMPEDYP